MSKRLIFDKINSLPSQIKLDLVRRNFPMFKLKSPFKPTGDQPKAIEKLVFGVRAGLKNQVLLGVTGSGKTFTMANVIKELNMPALVISHNKTLAGQLYQEFRDFNPKRYGRLNSSFLFFQKILNLIINFIIPSPNDFLRKKEKE